MNDLLHPLTRRQIKNFAAAPSQAVVLIGPAGIGKSKIAAGLAEQLLGELLEPYPYKLLLAPEDGKAIGIETVRQLEHFLSLKVPRSAPINRVVIIDKAQTLTLEAQNSLLKTLEEPPAGSLIILATDRAQALLPTVHSRLQTITVKRPERQVVEAYFQSEGYQSKAVAQAYAISGGLPGLMQAILDSEDHPLLKAVEKARQLLSLPTYEKLLLVDELAKQRDLALDTISILQQMADVSLSTASGAAAQKWQKVLEAGYQAAGALGANAQPKLALTKLMLNL
jgi:replication-associated recombination protein RarA